MVEIAGLGGGVVSFPVVFSDGESEVAIGNVAVYPTMEFKRFQDLLSQKIGLSPHQFSVHLSSPDSRRKIPITSKASFAAISRQKGCFFLVVLKRSRRDRRRKNDADSPAAKKAPPENVMLLRRNDGELGFGRDRDPLFYDRVDDLESERERFLRALILMGGPDSDLGPGRVDPRADCEDCLRANESGEESGFHCCVNDEVVFRFRSLAGPIARPYKRSF